MTRKTIFQYIMERIKEKPVTQEQIDQLKLKKKEAILKRDIALTKRQTPSKLKEALKALGSLSDDPKKRKLRL